jgi:hypothetical protein
VKFDSKEMYRWKGDKRIELVQDPVQRWTLILAALNLIAVIIQSQTGDNLNATLFQLCFRICN